MSQRDRITEEINRVLNDLRDNQKDWVPRWIANAVLKEHRSALNRGHKDADFWEHCGYSHVREQVRRCIARRTDPGQQDDPAQTALTLDGYAHVQTHYNVERDGDTEGVYVFNMTDEEIDQKVAYYRSMARSLNAHADELESFKKDRGSSAVAS